MDIFTFDEAVAFCEDYPDEVPFCFIAYRLRLDNNLIVAADIYLIYWRDAEEDDPGEVVIDFSGGRLFDSSGEELSFTLSNVPDNVKTLSWIYLSDFNHLDYFDWMPGAILGDLFSRLVP